jgi:predicted RNase H-like HicB family nuclease
VVVLGGTFTEAKRMAADAIRCYLEGLEKERSRFPPDVRRAPRIERVEVELEPA